MTPSPHHPIPSSPSYPPGSWAPVAADASTRQYFEGRWEGLPALLADFGSDLDSRERFLFVTGLFRSHGVRVPEIYHAPPGVSWLVQEFVAGGPLSAIRPDAALLRSVLEIADTIGHIPPWEGAPPVFCLDAARFRFELSFFREHFLEGYLNSQPGDSAREGLHDLASMAAAAPVRLCHRDFHSENILGASVGDLVVIDHQDALLGPSCYDAASLAAEAYRRADAATYRTVRGMWLDRDPASGPFFDAVALQRALKALGTFGYQVTRRKKARYIAVMAPSAAHAIRLLPAGPEGLHHLRPALEAVL